MAPCRHEADKAAVSSLTAPADGTPVGIAWAIALAGLGTVSLGRRLLGR
jgi:hypothetical protein